MQILYSALKKRSESLTDGNCITGLFKYINPVSPPHKKMKVAIIFQIHLVGVCMAVRRNKVEIAFRELSIQKKSRTEMLPGKRDFYRCCKARRSASHVNKEFWQQFQNYALPSLWVIRANFSRTIIGERAKRARHSQVCSIENRGYIY